ncbi:MAG: hypothetical protein MUP98_14375 [Candidatus Aminicenantes bacterium]|nr:hypothetical protein [Candidatus Aminicenantes bacterium]
MNYRINKVTEIQSKEKGVVLVIVLLVSVCLLILIMPFIFKLSGRYRSTNNTFHSAVAMNLSEGGVERAIWELNFGDITTWEGDSTQRTATIYSAQTSGGDIVGDIVISIDNPESDNPIVESMGRVNLNDDINFTRKIRVVLQRRGGEPLFNTGIFADINVIIRQNFTLDGNVQTNGTHAGAITILNNTTVNGDAICGPGGDPDVAVDLAITAQVVGEQRAADAPKELPSVEPPAELASQGDYYANMPGYLTGSDSGEYSSFTIDTGANILVTEDVTLYVTGEFNLNSNTELQVAEGARLTLYLSGSFYLNSDASLNTDSEDSTRLVILGTDDFTGAVTFDSNNVMYAGLYMPKADLFFSSNIEFHGSAIGKTVDVSAHVFVEYDEELVDLGTFQGLEFYIKSWQEKKLY